MSSYEELSFYQLEIQLKLLLGLIILVIMYFLWQRRKNNKKERKLRTVILFPLILYGITSFLSSTGLEKYKERALGGELRSKPILEYSVQGQISLRQDNIEQFTVEIKNIGKAAARDLEIYVIGKMAGNRFGEIAEYPIGDIEPGQSKSLDTKLLTHSINREINTKMQGELRGKSLVGLIISGKYKNPEGNTYDDWIRKEPIYHEAKIIYR